MTRRTGEWTESTGNEAQAQIGVEVLVGGDVSATALQAHFHLQLAAFRNRGDIHVLVQNLDVAVGFNHAGGDNSRLVGTQIQRLGTFARELEWNLLEIQDDVGRVFDDAGDRLELVQHAFNANRGNCRALNGAQQRTAQGVADGCAKSPLKGLRAELAKCFGQRLGIDCQALRFLKSSPKHMLISFPARQVRRDAFCGGRASSPSC